MTIVNRLTGTSALVNAALTGFDAPLSKGK